MEMFPLLIALAVMAGFTIGTGMIADRKGYNFLLFAIVGLFLGIFGLLLAAVLPRRKTGYDLG
jgi:hypothetical protein